MKITKLSLVAIAAMTITTGAMAEVTSELGGNVKLWYETADKDTATSDGLFAQSGASGQAAVSITAKGKAGVLGYGLKYTAVDTLGLENNLVSGVRTPGTSGTNTAHWAEKAFITYQMGKTTAKIGRQHLNTPLAFTEKWNVAANSFDAAVLMNSDIENVTLVAAYVGRSNGSYYGAGGTGTVQTNGQFSAMGTSGYKVAGANPGAGKDVVNLNGDGAYAVAALAKPIEGLGLNAWYYNVQDIADAVWIDADYAVAGVKLGALYAQMMPKGQTAALADTKAFAVKASTKAGPVSLFAAYSSVDDVAGKASLPVANVATGFKKTKLPTAGVYNDGLVVAQAGAETYKIKAVYPLAGTKLIAQYISASNDRHAGYEANEFDFIVAAKIADINVKAIYINRDFGASTQTDHQNVRVIAGINF